LPVTGEPVASQLEARLLAGRGLAGSKVAGGVTGSPVAGCVLRQQTWVTTHRHRTNSGRFGLCGEFELEGEREEALHFKPAHRNRQPATNTTPSFHEATNATDTRRQIYQPTS
jgi:hypothetical protein